VVRVDFSLQQASGTMNLDRFMTIFNYIQDMVFLIEVENGGQFRCLEVNPSYLRATGLKLDALKNKLIEEIFSPEEAVGVTENYQKAISKKHSLTYEESMMLNGEDKTFETTITPIFDENSSECCYILGVSRDISERKKYEKALLEAQSELKSMLEFQEGLILKIEKRHDDFFYTLCDGKLIDQLGLTSEEIIEKRPQDLFPDEISTNIIKHMQLCWDTKQKVTFEFSDQVQEKEIFWLNVLSPIIEKGKTSSLIAYCIDILERKKSEESVLKKEKLAVIGELAAGIGHELRNPLTAIRGFIKFMRENKEHIKDDFLDIIDSELESLNHIASELMILAKPQAKYFNHLNLIQILDEAVFLLEPEAFKQGVKLFKNYHDSYLPVYGEKVQLKQVFINLIKNAMEAVEGQPEGRVFIDCGQKGSEVIVTIRDNGYGMPKEILEKIGEPFYTTKEKGTGLGLLVSYRIIKNHEGSVECLSEEGKGTSFIIRLPVS
jgi:PAS domain S-box-containing protein